MPQYYLHLHIGHNELLDPDGQQFGSLDEVRDATLQAARGMMCADLSDGTLDLRSLIVVEDEAGVVVHTLRFEEAVNIILDLAEHPHPVLV